jgi:hypothetical protein
MRTVPNVVGDELNQRRAGCDILLVVPETAAAVRYVVARRRKWMADLPTKNRLRL